MGSTSAALAAGYIPNRMPIPILITRGSIMLIGVKTVGIPVNRVINKGMKIPRPRPRIPPIVESTTVSIKN